MDAGGNVDRTRGNVKHTYVSSLHAIGLDHDVRALGFHAAGEDVECAAGARDRGGAAGEGLRGTTGAAKADTAVFLVFTGARVEATTRVAEAETAKDIFGGVGCAVQ